MSSVTNNQSLFPTIQHPAPSAGPAKNGFFGTPLYPALALQFLPHREIVQLAKVSRVFWAASKKAYEFEMQAKKTVSFSQLYDFAIHKSPSTRLADGSISKRVENFVAISSYLKKVTELDLSKVNFRKDPFMLIHTLTPQVRSNIVALNFAEANDLLLGEVDDLLLGDEGDVDTLGAVETLTLEGVIRILQGVSPLNSPPTFPNLNSLNFKGLDDIEPIALDEACSFLLKGHGTVTYADGVRYEGAWLNGMPQGQGVMFYTDGSKYEGALKEADCSGKGKLTYADGSTVEGIWLGDNFFSGRKTILCANGAKLEEAWLEGAPNEQKTKTFPNGDKLVGVWKKEKSREQGGPWYSNEFLFGDLWTEGIVRDREGFFCGLGKKTFANGDVYEGAWEEGRPHGQGTRTYPNGDRLVGMWIEGLFSGQGRRVFANGETYEGSWEGGNPNGQGTMVYPNGDALEGIWVRGFFSGQGKRTVNGDMYQGAWLEGQPNGKGIMTYANGDWFEGTFLKGKFSQEGMLTAYANGEKLEGFWLEGQKCFKKRRF